MLLERNEAISAQPVRSTQAKEVAHRKASLQLEVVEIRPAEIIAQQTKTVDWSSVSAFEKKLGQWFFDKHYPVEVTAPLRRFFQEVTIKDRTGRSEVKLAKTDEASVLVNGKVVPVIFKEDMGSALFEWTRCYGS